MCFTHRCVCSQRNENCFVITDSRSRGEAATPIVTRVWVIASGPSSAMRGRFFPQRLSFTKKKKKKNMLIGDSRLLASCVHHEVTSSTWLWSHRDFHLRTQFQGSSYMFANAGAGIALTSTKVGIIAYFMSCLIQMTPSV